MVGVLTSALFVCLTVVLLDRAYGFGTQELPAPQATLMKLVIEGVLDKMLPWTLVGIGVAIALVAQLAGVPVLAFAVCWFLACHLLESSALPLELVFEHRNYQASVGVWLALASGLALLLRNLLLGTTFVSSHVTGFYLHELPDWADASAALAADPAVAARYRFYSYGDACLLSPASGARFTWNGSWLGPAGTPMRSCASCVPAPTTSKVASPSGSTIAGSLERK